MTVMTLLRFVIEPEGRWAIAAPEAAALLDRPVSQDPLGNTYVPATSLAGSLRAHLHEIDAALTAGLMGAAPGAARPKEARTEDERQEEQRRRAADASALRLLGTVTFGTERDLIGQTAIDRVTGTAGKRMFRQSVMVDGGTITLYARIDRLLSDAERAALSKWVPEIGGRRAAGLGRSRLTSLRLGRLDLSSPADLLRFLTGGGPDLFDAVCRESIDVSQAVTTPLLQVQLEIVDGLLVAVPGRDGDRQLARPYRESGSLTIPGSSLRGVLRSRAEYILRSLEVEVCELGVCGAKADSEELELSSFCLACQIFGTTGYASPLRVDAGIIDEASAALSRRPHVAIDRITGGARDGKLFQEEIISSGRFTLTIRQRPGTSLPAGTLGLLGHVLRDLDDGLVGLGGRVTRGMGTVRLVEPDAVREILELEQEPFVAMVGT